MNKAPQPSPPLPQPTTTAANTAATTTTATAQPSQASNTAGLASSASTPSPRPLLHHLPASTFPLPPPTSSSSSNSASQSKPVVTTASLSPSPSSIPAVAVPPLKSEQVPPRSPHGEPRTAKVKAQKQVDVGKDSEKAEGVVEDRNAVETGSDVSSGKASPDELEIERLRNLQLKVLQQQQRSRVKPAATSAMQGIRRISPINEEPTAASNLSPTLEGAFASPAVTSASPLATSHTESTESSSRTIRGSMPATPAGHALRTPSYPFPTIPNTPRAWPSPFHQPFTTLSPTQTAMYQKDVATPRDLVTSEGSTPAASNTPFAPAGMRESPLAHDPRYPTPSLYDLVLQLNAEPGLPAWWHCVTVMLQECYGAQRATLAVPADTSDIENVPWGQKTTFNSNNGHPEPLGDAQPASQPPTQAEQTGRETVTVSTSAPSSPGPEQRPSLYSRHSFAGHEQQGVQDSREPARASLARPHGPRRTVSHAPHSVARDHPLRQVSPASFDGTSHPPMATPAKESTFSDPDFSSIGGDAGNTPPTGVFPVLRALDHEPDALIDNTGVSRVLERGRLVTLTRDYTPSLPTPRRSSEHEHSKAESNKPSQKHATTSAPEAPSGQRQRRGSGRGTKLTPPDSGEQRIGPRYEEYEQFPTSPWAQSPAPSPAIQHDETEENPFFTASNVDEDSFNPRSTSEDYSRYEVVEAIGIDKASTVTHIPLIHPTLSQPMHSTEPATPYKPPSPGKATESIQSSTPPNEQIERRAPIAILSFLSPIVPYPRNLTNSLKLLGPHLATSFSNAWQYTSMQAQGTSIRRHGNDAGKHAGMPHHPDRHTLEDLLHLDLENMSSSAAGSMTSPSDYSGRSKYSPGGSIGGTPGWDPSTLGFSSKHSVGNTPGHLSGAEAVESYFDAKRRSTRVGHAPSPSQEQASRKSDQKPPKRTTAEAEDDDTTPRIETVPPQSTVHDDVHGESAAARHRAPPRQHSHNRPHSLLHSYGADFSSSFQSLPAATTPGSKPGTRGVQDTPEMPPPSESLLRTIIDSLPVQIFTALPTTGALTWVNSKFLVYRGQDSRQVLQDPWDSIHPEDKQAYLEQWNASLRTGQQLQRKVRLQRFDGHYRWFYVRVAPLRNKRQQIVHWIGTNMDVHDQHLAEINSARQQETAASEAKYRALANSSPQIVFVVSDRRGLSFCNSQWITYSGQSEAQAHGNGFLEYVHPDDVPKCKLPELSEDGTLPTNVPTSLPPDQYRGSSSSSDDSRSSDTERAVMSPGSPSLDKLEMPQAKLSKLASTGILRVTKDASGRASYSTEVRLRSKDGEYRWHLVRILLEKALAEDTDEETWYGTATDINDHKLLEQTLKETMDAKTRFLSNMSHEIRTPLNGISGMVNFLLDSPLIPEQLEHVNIIKASTDSLLNLINDILDLSKVEAGMIKLDMGWLHIPSLLEEVNDLNMGLAIQKGLELNYLVEEGVPSMVKGDKFRIRQVLLNVVGNAIKFTQKGEVFVRCRPCPPERQGSLHDDEAMVQFEVIDTGKGFNEEEAKYLFKRFSQIDASSTRQHGGTGLGLAISMQFVELHGGKMDARSVPGNGSTFFFTIKFGLPNDETHPPTPAPTVGTPVFEPVNLPSPSPSALPSQKPMQAQVLQAQAAANILAERMSASPEYTDSVKSPVPSLTASERSRDSPSISVSSGGSDPSFGGTSATGKSSLRSERSSASSFMQEVASKEDPMKLALPSRPPEGDRASSDNSTSSLASDQTLQPSDMPSRSGSPLIKTVPPPMYSILVVCPLLHSQEATIRHIKNTLPRGIPHQVTGQSSLLEAQRMIGGDDAVRFTHIVLVLHDTVEVIAIMDQILSSTAQEKTSIVVVSDPARKRELMKAAPQYDYDQLYLNNRLQFVYRPLKPSKFAAIFDPQKERELSTDRNQDSAHQVVVSQKAVFDELKRRIGGKGHKVLLVEDNKINQTVCARARIMIWQLTNIL